MGDEQAQSALGINTKHACLKDFTCALSLPYKPTTHWHRELGTPTSGTDLRL